MDDADDDSLVICVEPNAFSIEFYFFEEESLLNLGIQPGVLFRLWARPVETPYDSPDSNTYRGSLSA